MGLYGKTGPDGPGGQFGPGYGKYGAKFQRFHEGEWDDITSRGYGARYYDPAARAEQGATRDMRRGMGGIAGRGNVGLMTNAAVQNMRRSTPYGQLARDARQGRRQEAAGQEADWQRIRHSALEWWAKKQGLGLQAEALAQQAGLANAQGGGWLESMLGSL